MKYLILSLLMAGHSLAAQYDLSIPVRNVSNVATNTNITPTATLGVLSFRPDITDTSINVGHSGFPDIIAWDTTIAYDSGTDSIGLSDDFYDWLASPDGYMPRAEAESTRADLQDQIDNISLTPGPTGATGATGAAGTNGTNGTNGATGATGPAGADAVLTFTTTGTGAATYNGSTKALNIPTPALGQTIANGTSKTLVTSTTGQGGVVLDASKNVMVNYSVSTSTTSTIGGSSSVTLFLEVAATNSATAGDWTTIASTSNGQTITLAVALQSVQTSVLNFGAVVEAGKYMRIRYTTTGTASATYSNGQETKL